MDRFIRSPLLAGILHGFSTRIGAEKIDGRVIRLKQVHSADVVTVTETKPWEPGEEPEADALVTKQSGVTLGTVTADCAPVLFADVTAGVVGAAHAGWRGAVGGVLENTVAAMEQLGSRRDAIVAAIGPCIAQASYEVDQPFRDQFDEVDACHFASGKPGHWQFDLPGFVASRLVGAGIAQVHDFALDTYADENRFHSYRRATHRKEPTEGRQISFIGTK